MIDDVTIDVFIGPLYGSLRKFCTRCVLYVEPHSGPRRAERAKRCWPTSRGALPGISRRRAPRLVQSIIVPFICPSMD